MNTKMITMVAMLFTALFGWSETVLSTASSASVQADTTFVDGSSVSSKLKIDYGPFDWDEECVVTLNGTVMLSSDKRGAYTWQPQKTGVNTLVWSSAGVAMTSKVNVASLSYAVAQTANPPMAKDNNISITPTTRDIPVGGEGAAILVSGSSATWTAAVSDSWIRLGATSGNVGYPVSYMVDANTNVEERVGYVYVSGHVHTVKQAGWGGSISPSNKEFECDGGYGTVNVTAQNKMVWHARPNVDWLSVTPTSGAGEGTVTYQVAPWHEVSTRSGTLTIAGQTFTVFQYGKRMKLEQTTGTCNYETHVFPITVNALAITSWSVTPNNSWISVVDGGNGQGSDLVTVAVGENPSYAPRTGTVTIGTETFTITQEGRTALAFSVSPTETTASVNGANGLISVFATPDLPWTAASQANWLTVMAQFKSGSGNGNVVYTASPNPTLYQRAGTITVTPEAKSGLKAKTQTVTQPAAQATISLTGYEFAAAGESVSVDVTVANIVEWGVANLPSWLTASKMSFVGPGAVTLQASQNETVYPRSATIKIAEHNFVVTQKARGIEVEYDTKLFKTDGGSDSISVHPDGNVSWTAVASDPTWIVLYAGTSGTGDGEVLYIVAPYVGTGEPRTGTITIGDKVIYITQRAYDLTIDPYAQWVTGNAGAGEIGVSASIGDVWTAIVTAPWIKTVSGYDAGTGSGTVRFVYEDNDTGKTRTGKIVIAGEVYTLTQAARTMVAVTASVEGGGTVSGAGSYVLGTEVSLTAVPDDGWEFKYWTGDVSTMQNPVSVTADVAKSVTAVFGALTPEFTSATSDETGVTLTWTNLAWAVQYKIYRAPTSENVGAVIATVTADGTHSYVDTTGDVGKTYWYWVEAIGADATTESKQPASGTKKAPIVISSITYTNLRGATHSNTNAYQEGTVVSFSLPQGGPVGYTFAGWSPAAITADMTGNRTVTANWTANAYSVTYHANGGSGTMDATPMTYDVEGLVASNEFTFAGHRFVGWATSADGEVVYAEGAAVSNLTTSVGGVYELWAKWAECKVDVPTIAPANGSFFGTPTCMVTLSCATEGATIYCRTGGGSPKATETYRYKGPFTISDTTIIKAFATKDGWTQSEILEATLTKIDLSLEAAIDVGSGVTVTTGGDASWETAVDDGAKTGGKCAQSGAISDGEESWIQLAVSGAGTMTFWTKVSCEADEPMHEFDHLAVFIDGVEKTDFRLDGESGWVPRTVTLTTAGSHTVKVAYEKDESDAEGEDCAWLDGVVWTPSAAPVGPSVEDDPGATVTGNASAGYVIKPSEGKTSVEVTIPTGVEPSKVTVEVSSSVETIRPNGASVRVVKGTSDITSYLDIPTAVNGVVNLGAAEVKAAIVKEAMDPAAGAQIEINAENPSLTTSATKPGLVYTLREGASLEGMSPGDSKVGDGQPWTPNVKVKGGTSGFYSIGVTK